MRYRILISVFFVAGALAGPLPAQDAPKPAPEPLAKAKPAPEPLSKEWLAPLEWRPIGPANMGGRITAIAVYEKDPYRWWVATASGGLLKTVNDGITFEHQFDRESTVSIGDVAVAQSDGNIVWVGTGEANPRNSVSWGDGVYKSTDGGATWTNMGLEKSFQIGAIRIHPKNPDIVYVGALGRLWGTNEERGLFKTTDGGKTWKKILHVDDKTGVIDVQMHPNDPETLLVATYERQRDGFDTNDPAKKVGPGSGLQKTTDGGKTFKKITKGIPTGNLGRIGLDYYRKNPDIVYMVLESEKTGREPEDAPYMGINGADADVGARLTQVVKDGPCEKAGFKKDDIVLKIGEETVHSYGDLIRLARRHVAGDTVKVEVSRERKSVFLDLTFGPRPKPREGRKARSIFSAGLGGQRANLQDQQGKQGDLYGGVYRSEDGGESFTRINSNNPRPMYFSEIRVDPNDDNHVFVLGIRLWRSKDGGKEFASDGGRGAHVDHHALWMDPKDGRHLILGNDGGIYVSHDRGDNWDHLNHVAIGQFYHVAVGPRRDYRVYGGLQDNGSWGGPSRVRHTSGPTNQDWINVGGGDGFSCRVDANDPDLVYFTSQNGGIGRRHLRTGERAGMRPRTQRGGTRYRFNWSTPFALSHHNSRIYYVAGNRVFRSLDRGNGLRTISPEITVTDRGSATAFAESPGDPNLLYVGTDDGALWVTRDGGHNWKDLYVAPEPKEKSEPEKPEAPAPEPRPGRSSRMIEMMMGMDANGDGKLQKEELPERAMGFFERADANKDGVVDEAELKTMAGRFRGGGTRGRSSAGRTGGASAAGSAPPGSAIHDLMPDRRWVSWIEPSRFETGRAYLVFDGHRSDDDRAYLFVTEDFGATWRSIVSDLPESAGTTRVLREDLVNPDLLYLGTELGAFFSIDRGVSWKSLNTNLPTVAVHAFALHPTAGEIVAATHGRSLWILDVTTLRQMKPESLSAEAWLYRPNQAIVWRPEPRRGRSRTFTGRNPRSGAEIHYSLAKKAGKVGLKIVEQDGDLVRELEASGEAGLHRVGWDLRYPRSKGQRGRFRAGRRAGPGTYRVVLTVGEEVFSQDLELAMDPENPDPRWIANEEAAEDLEADRLMEREKRRMPWRHLDGED